MVNLVGLVMRRVSMIGVYGVYGESMFMGDNDMSNGSGVVIVGFGGGGLAAVCWVGVLGGAGLLCFLSLFRPIRRSCRSCCRRLYCGVVGVVGEVLLWAICVGLLSGCCGSVGDGECCRLVHPCHRCGGKSCRFARLCLRGGIVVVAVVDVAIVSLAVCAICAVTHSGDGVGGFAGSAHRCPPGVRLPITVILLLGGGSNGGAFVAALNSAKPFASAVIIALFIVMGVVGVFAGDGVGGIAGAAHKSSSGDWSGCAGALALFAELTISSQFIASGRLSSGLPWCCR